MRDPGLIRQIKTSFLEIPYSIKGVKTSDLSTGDKIGDKGLDFDSVFDTELIPVIGALDPTSPNMSSSGFGPDHLGEDAFLIEGVNGAASQVQSWQFVDDEFSNSGVRCSMNSSDCISQTLVKPVKVVSIPKGEKLSDQCDAEEVGLIESQSDDVHYHGFLSSLLKSHHQLILGPHFLRAMQESSFMSWKRGGTLSSHNPRGVNPLIPQRVLKKILFEVPRKHDLGKCSDENAKKDEVSRPESDQIHLNHMLLDGPEGELIISERFYALKSIIPSTGKVLKFLWLYSYMSTQT